MDGILKDVQRLKEQKGLERIAAMMRTSWSTARASQK